MGRGWGRGRSSHKPVAESAQLGQSVFAPIGLHDRGRTSMDACLPAGPVKGAGNRDVMFLVCFNI